VQTCVTSPPYYGLRDYGVDGQIGLEETPEAYVAKLVAVFREVRRALKDDGTLWLNLGDSYWGGKGKSGYELPDEAEERRANGETFQTGHNIPGYMDMRPTDGKHPVIKPKDLIGIPWMVAFALRADGWWLRSDIIWAKPNPMPESVTDRPTKSHEYIFLLTKSARYYYDAEAIMEDSVDEESYTGRRYRGPKTIFLQNGYAPGMSAQTFDKGGPEITGKVYGKRNKRDVWTVTTKPYREAHFATFPPDLIEPCILAGSRPGDTVLDPFNGSGTTGEVAIKHHRNYIGCELNPEYIELTNRRLAKVQPTLIGE
jgi:DNA modification methylase